jgi:hypothetical protein
LLLEYEGTTDQTIDLFGGVQVPILFVHIQQQRYKTSKSGDLLIDGLKDLWNAQ